MTGKSIAQCCALAAALALLAYAPARAASDSWQPIDPADLAMKSEPLAPGASAIYLYREVEVDDTQGYTDYYYRVKILTDAGKDAATVHIPQITFGELSETVSNVRGRTIHPDGTIIPWQGQIIQQSVARARGIKEMAKTFSLPDVQTGSIIEYRFRIGWDRTWLFETEFVANADLFTRQLHCTLKRYEEDYYLAWQTEHMPGNQVPVQDNHDLLWHFDAQNLPGIQDEEFMPPKEVFEFLFVRGAAGKQPARPRISDAVREHYIQAEGDLVDEVVHVAFQAAIVVTGKQDTLLAIQKHPPGKMNSAHTGQPAFRV